MTSTSMSTIRTAQNVHPAPLSMMHVTYRGRVYRAVTEADLVALIAALAALDRLAA